MADDFNELERESPPAQAPAPSAKPPALRLEGFVETIVAGRVTGWVRAVGDDRPLEVDIFYGGELAGKCRADIMRPDLQRSGKGTGAHMFDFMFDPPIPSPFRNERLRVRVTGSSFVVPHVPKLANAVPHDASPRGATDQASSVEDTSSAASGAVSSSMLPSPAAPPSAGGSHGEGEVLGIDGGDLVGWASEAQGGSTLLVTVDGRMIGEATAAGATCMNLPPHPHLARHGFRFGLPHSLLTGVERKVAIYGTLTGKRLHMLERLHFPQGVAEAGQPAALRPGVAPHAYSRPPALPAPSPGVVAADGAGSHAGVAPAAVSRPAMRIAVVAWDTAHNPVGRAFMLADMLSQDCTVELVGPSFAFYGDRLWPPIAGTQMAIRRFPASDMKSLVTGAVQIAKDVHCDAVVVCKPRLPSLLIGMLIREANGCPLLLDIDDHELSFTRSRTPASFEELQRVLASDVTSAETPYSDIWTRFSETLVAEADSVVVSNIALRRKFGGVVVRHARDEVLFNPALYDRAKVRAEFGYTDTDRVVLFLGTPRPHKGVFELAGALEAAGDPRLALCIIGTITDKRTLARFAEYPKARIALHPDQPWARLPELVTMADMIAILQDPADTISQFQMPAKLTDSLALDVPVMATPVPPLSDLAEDGIFETVRSADDILAALRRLAASPPRVPGKGRSREIFLGEFSYGVNRARLKLGIETARQQRKANLPGVESLFRLLQDRTGTVLPRVIDAPARLDRRTSIRPGDQPRDLVFLWKQNDSGIYGRRQDMIAKYLLRSGRVRRIVHFDAPLSAAELDRQAADSDGDAAHQGSFVYLNTVRRVLGMADTANLYRRTFVHRSGSRPERAIGRDLPPRADYPEFVRRTLAELHVQEAPLLWVCPIVFDYPAVADVVRPAAIIADIIDDQRTFPGASDHHRRLVTEAYTTILTEADLVISNCPSIRDAFATLREDIAVVPNGAENPGARARSDAPAELDSLARPIIGYVGNMRDRIDFDLVQAVAKAHPTGTVVLVGSAHGRPEVKEAASRCPNIRMLGVKSYKDAKAIMRGFDVAIMPHLKNEQSDRMNPLKLYVYFSVGVPVVTTAVANIGDIAPYVDVAHSSEAFLDAIAEVLAGKRPALPEEERGRILADFSWERRIGDIWRALERGG